MTTKNIQLIEYQPAYAKAVAEMWNRSSDAWNGEVFNQSEEIVRNNEASSTHLNLYLATDGEKVVGYCKLAIYAGDDDTLYIDLLSADPAYHGQGIGKMLVLKCVERTIELGYPRLDLFTWEGNQKAVPLYKKCGFFWEKMDSDSTHLMNFIPFIMNSELCKPFFDKINWYQDSTRVIEILPDGNTSDGFDFYQYCWEKDKKTYIMEFEKTGRGLTKIDFPDYSISTKIAEAKPIFGKSYEIEYEFINKGSKPLEISLQGLNDKNIEFDFDNKLILINSLIVKAKFKINEPEKSFTSWQTKPAVKTEIKVNSSAIIFKTGLNVKYPLNICFSHKPEIYNPQLKNTVFLNLDNNFHESAEFQISFPEDEKIFLQEKEFSVNLNALAKTSLEIPFKMSKAAIYQPLIRVSARTENGETISFKRKLYRIFPTFDGQFSGTLENDFVIGCGRYQFSVTKNDWPNQGQLHDYMKNTGIDLRFPAIGKPYSGEFENIPAYKAEYQENINYTEMKLFYKSKEFVGCEFSRVYRLCAQGILECCIETISLPEGISDIWAQISFEIPMYKNTLVYDGEVVEYENDNLHSSCNSFSADKFSENWIFMESKRSTYGFIWPSGAKVNFAEWYQFIEFNLSERFRNGQKITEPLIIASGCFNNAEVLRKYVMNSTPEHVVKRRSLELLANNNNPFVSDKLEIVLDDCKNTPINANVTLKSETDSFAPMTKTVTDTDNLTKIDFQPVIETFSPIDILDCTVEFKSFELNRKTAIFKINKNEISFTTEKMKDLNCLCADNGILKIKACAEFAPSLFSMEYQGKEWLDTNFPKAEPKSWYNPWWGGIYFKPSGIKSLALAEEEHQVKTAQIEDNQGNLWQGIEIITKIEKFDAKIKGLEYSQYYLMLPGVPLVLQLIKVKQNTGSSLNIAFDNYCFTKPSEKITDGSFWTQLNNKLTTIKCGLESVSQNQMKDVYGFTDNLTSQKFQICFLNHFDDYTQISTSPELNNIYQWFEYSLKNKEQRYLAPVYYIIDKKRLDNECLRSLQQLKFNLKIQ